MIPSQDRSTLRGFYHTVWRKKSEGQPLEPLEHLVGTVIDMHPEYHTVLANPASMAEDFEGPNPYLHMGMHIALQEQLQAGRPSGIRGLYRRIVRRFPDPHDAEHAMIACLREAMMRAPASGQGFDVANASDYLSALRKLARGR